MIKRPLYTIVVVAGLSIMTGLLTGCGGNVRCNFVSQNMASIRVEPTDARSIMLTADECYWWVDDQGRLNLAGQGVQKSLLGSAYDREFLISFILTEPSQGVGKDYHLTLDSVRGYIKLNNNIYRFESIFGILGSENRPDNRLIASYRCNIRIQSAKLLGGWSNPVQFLIFGTLQATPDRQTKGREILRRTEEDGFERAEPRIALR
ncbi:MAG: hypothetical protein GX629_01080 [Phycisphaerae bacterium]|nr:hypothetical protein [Phycisphaerae bacterium]